METIRRQGLYHSLFLVLAGDIAQDGLVDRTCQREPEVGILTIAHIPEILMRQRFKDGAGNDGQTCLRVIAVSYLTSGPVAITVFHVGGQVVEQGRGQFS